jgi:hypothetical protein
MKGKRALTSERITCESSPRGRPNSSSSVPRRASIRIDVIASTNRNPSNVLVDELDNLFRVLERKLVREQELLRRLVRVLIIVVGELELRCAVLEVNVENVIVLLAHVHLSLALGDAACDLADLGPGSARI